MVPGNCWSGSGNSREIGIIARGGEQDEGVSCVGVSVNYEGRVGYVRVKG